MVKKLLTLITLMGMSITMHAQFDKGFVHSYFNMRDAEALMRDHITRDMAGRGAKLKVLPNKKWLLDEGNW